MLTTAITLRKPAVALISIVMTPLEEINAHLDLVHMLSKLRALSPAERLPHPMQEIVARRQAEGTLTPEVDLHRPDDDGWLGDWNHDSQHAAASMAEQQLPEDDDGWVIEWNDDSQHAAANMAEQHKRRLRDDGCTPFDLLMQLLTLNDDTFLHLMQYSAVWDVYKRRGVRL